jgi:hypothetical protein
MMITSNDIINAISVGWSVANDIDTCYQWRTIRAELSGMQSLMIYTDMSVEDEAKETARFLWDIALLRG